MFTISDCGSQTGIVAADDGPGIAVHVDGLTPDDARAAGRALARLADQLTPAAPEAIAVLEVPLAVINDLRGTDWTVAGVAADCGVDDLRGATAADVERISRHVATLVVGP